MALFYPLAATAMKALLVSLSRWQVLGQEHVPPEGPLLIVANHLNLIDPPLLGASIPRRIVFMAKQELFQPSPGAVFVRALGAFPVRRGGLDREAIRQALGVLEDGLALGMFPEGKRSPDAQLQKAYPGVSIIALRYGVPILPVGISGTEAISGLSSVISHRPRITVAIGEPFSLPPIAGRLTREQLAQFTDLIMGHIAELLPPIYRGVYGRGGQG